MVSYPPGSPSLFYFTIMKNTEIKPCLDEFEYLDEQNNDEMSFSELRERLEALKSEWFLPLENTDNNVWKVNGHKEVDNG